MLNKRGGEGWGVKISGGLEIFIKFNNRGGQNKRGLEIAKYPLISVMSEKTRQKC